MSTNTGAWFYSASIGVFPSDTTRVKGGLYVTEENT
jgi:hypothetical protein